MSFIQVNQATFELEIMGRFSYEIFLLLNWLVCPLKAAKNIIE